jgi:uncharacterized membrane protein YhiD involved in acid resistance
MIDWTATAPLSLSTFAINIGIGLVLSLIVAWYYEHYGQSLSNRRKFGRLLPVLTVTTAIVITIVKSSLALSLGLVGALSIVRFRTAIKEPEELIFLFIAIAIGLGLGADQRWLTVFGVFILLAYMAARLVLQDDTGRDNLYLNILVQEDGAATLFNRINATLLEHVDVLDFRRLDSRDGSLQLTYFIEHCDPAVLDGLVDDLKTRFSVSEISFIQQEQGIGG